jgi:ParB family chromosome partitioning protein
MAPSINEVACCDIERGLNIRHELRTEKVREISLSIKSQGILVPLWLEPGQTKPYRIVDGEHRYAAAQMLGLKTIPALVQDAPLSSAQRTERQLVINSQRSDLTPIEKAQAINGLMNATGLTAAAVAGRIGASTATVSKLLALLTLPQEVQEMVSGGRLAASAAYALSQEPNPERQLALATNAAEKGLTRDQLARRTNAPAEPSVTPRNSSRVTLHLPGTRKLTLSGESISLETFIESLETIVSHARKSARSGCDLTRFVALMNAKTRANA